ncbi:hypothetical protein HPP92_004957 [Vanilla planifolia]|uniref:Uncharacterized protein n=1 Tax=Vanilla planifolia TaxID=51239 RepID=A0A835V8L8_VANPL|nr:hypothetical protein HPP92_004957 [Vanilla planifolia]
MEHLAIAIDHNPTMEKEGHFIGDGVIGLERPRNPVAIQVRTVPSPRGSGESFPFQAPSNTVQRIVFRFDGFLTVQSRILEDQVWIKPRVIAHCPRGKGADFSG